MNTPQSLEQQPTTELGHGAACECASCLKLWPKNVVVPSKQSIEFAMRQADRCRNYGPEQERTENENCIVVLAEEIERLNALAMKRWPAYIREQYPDETTCCHPVLVDNPNQRDVNDYICARCDARVLVNELSVSAPEKTASPQAPIAKLIVAEDDSVTATMYAPGLPVGEHEVYCEPEAVAPYMRGEKSTPVLCIDCLELKNALAAAVGVANEAREQLDRDNDTRALKILTALSGHLPKYRNDTDRVHDVLRRAVDRLSEKAPDSRFIDFLRAVSTQQAAGTQDANAWAAHDWLTEIERDAEKTTDVQLLFNKGLGAQKGNRFSFSFETEDEANRAFHYIANLGTLETSQPPLKSTEPCGEVCGGHRCVLPKGHEGFHDDEWPTEPAACPNCERNPCVCASPPACQHCLGFVYDGHVLHDPKCVTLTGVDMSGQPMGDPHPLDLAKAGRDPVTGKPDNCEHGIPRRHCTAVHDEKAAHTWRCPHCTQINDADSDFNRCKGCRRFRNELPFPPPGLV
jgi:hypothetical protein